MKKNKLPTKKNLLIEFENYINFRLRRGGRVVEGARLESVYTSNRIKGSNPFLSAIF